MANLGLPPDATFATDGDTAVPGPVLLTAGPEVYLLAKSPGAGASQWWLAAVDVRDGRAAFPPVALNTASRAPGCFVNGASVVCIADDLQAATAWVIDRVAGKLEYTGPSAVRLRSGPLQARQIGDYLVAQTSDAGVHGVGQHAEATWFVPGTGIIASHTGDTAYQSRGEGLGGNVFALADGTIVRTELPAEARFQTLRFFDGGFAASVSKGQKATVIDFFDSKGELTNDEHVEGQQVTGTTANLTTVIEDGQHWGVYTAYGERLLRLARERAGGVQLIGSTLWVNARTDGGVRRAQPYDLRTGDAGAPCDFDFDGYLGTDGTIALRTPSNPKSNDLAEAYDLASCTDAWSIPRPPGSLARLSRIGTTLVQLSDDGNELTSLVAPR